MQNAWNVLFTSEAAAFELGLGRCNKIMGKRSTGSSWNTAIGRNQHGRSIERAFGLWSGYVKYAIRW
jgi:hypothetical protein